MAEEALFNSEEAAESTDDTQPDETQSTDEKLQADADKANAAADEANDRPDWLQENYKTVEEQAKAYVELNKKFQEGRRAPDAYELEMPDGIESLGDEVMEAFKAAGLSNKQAQEMANLYGATLLPQFQEMKQEIEQEKLLKTWNVKSDEGTERYNKVVLWAKKHFGDEVVALHQGSASGILYLESEMRARAEQGRTDDRMDGKAADVDSDSARDTIRARFKDPRYNPYDPKHDPDFVRETERMMLALEQQQ